jgi:hypothetical protein
MTPETSSRVLVLLSMVYGISIAIMAMTSSGGIGLVAIIGAMILGVLWTARAMFMKRPG